MLKETTAKFSSKITEQEKQISLFTKLFEERLENMSSSNIVGTKIDVAKLEIETKTANNIADIQAEKIKNMTNIEMKLSYITSRQPSSSYQPNTDQ